MPSSDWLKHVAEAQRAQTAGQRELAERPIPPVAERELRERRRRLPVQQRPAEERAQVQLGEACGQAQLRDGPIPAVGEAQALQAGGRLPVLQRVREAASPGAAAAATAASRPRVALQRLVELRS